MDLRGWARPDRGKALLDLIDQCPSACRWREAMALDEEVQEAILAEEDPDAEHPKWAPRVSEYDLNALLLHEVIRLLGEIAQKKSLKKYNAPPLPHTAEKVARQRLSERASDELMDLIAPHAVTDDDY